MADRLEPASLDKALTSWFKRLGSLERELTEHDDDLAAALSAAEVLGVFDELAGRLTAVAERGRNVAVAAEAIRERVQDARTEWLAARRWTDQGLDDLQDTLTELAAQYPLRIGSRWLSELFDALDAQAWDAVCRVATLEVAWPKRLKAGHERISRDVMAWRDGDIQRGLRLMRTLADAQLERWDDVLGPLLRSRAHRLAAWLSLCALNETAAALKHLDHAVALYPYGGRMLAERGAYWLNVGDFDLGATDAQQAIDRAGEESTGFLELGIWAELTGEYGAADGLYRRGLNRMPTFEVERLSSRAALIDPPGRLLVRAAQSLAQAGRMDSALRLADDALLAGVRGAEPYPHAEAHRLRSEALEAGGAAVEAALAAVTAGKLFLWNDDTAEALKQFGRARVLDPQLGEAAWLTVDAELARSLPVGAAVPDAKLLREAELAWDIARTAHAPEGELSWAYLTRAVIADLSTQLPGTRRARGVWSAITFVERALVHDDTDAQRWGYAAQYLRYAGLHRLALEALRAGTRLAPDDRRVMMERLHLAVIHANGEEGRVLAARVTAVYGPDGTVSGLLAQLALRAGDHEAALGHLAHAVEIGGDPLWYLDMRALCLAAQGNAAAGRLDCARIVDLEREGIAAAVDGTDKCRLASASLVIGDRDAAHGWLAAAEADATAPAPARHAVAAWIRVTEGDVAGASEALRAAFGSAHHLAELLDLRRELPLRLRLLDGVGTAPEDLLDGAADDALAKRRTYLERDHPTADTELAAALAAIEDDREGDEHTLATTALWAIDARRHLRTGQLDDAAALYDQLRGRFDPEATIGLARALGRQSDQYAADGDVDNVRRLHARLRELGKATPARSAQAIALALAVRGDYDLARGELREHLEATMDDHEREGMHRQLGGLALSAGDLESARSELSAALELARGANPANVGELELQLSVLAFEAGDEAAVFCRLQAATRAWSGPDNQDAALGVAAEFVRLVALARDRGLSAASDDAASIAERWLAQTDTEAVPHLEPALEETARAAPNGAGGAEKHADSD